uniref:Major facilitator superfamily (MFS) profile domain-containing protein n=1 Tax=Zea mays TaxID=4577 RepID=A0A804MS27_MAIZE
MAAEGEVSMHYTTDDALSLVGFGRFQTLVLAYSGLGWIAEAFEIMLLSFVGPAVEADWGISGAEQGLISSAVFAGMLIGSIAGGLIADRYGRRVCPCCQKRYLDGCFPCLLDCGNNIGGSSCAIMPVLGWRWLLALSSAPCFVLLIFFPLTPESPRYLCSRGRTMDATVILERIARMNKGTLPPGVLIFRPEKHVDNNLGTSETALLIAEDNTGIEEDTSSKSSGIVAFQALWSYDLIRSTFLLWFIYLANYFTYYGVILLTSELSNGKRRCASVRTHLMQPNSGNLYRDVLVTSLAEFPGLLLAALLVDRIGRKRSMGGMLLLCGVFLAPLSLQLGEGLVTTLLFCARTCIMGSFAVLYVYTPELYPAPSRNTGVGITSSLGRIGSIVSPLVIVGLLESCRRKEAVFVVDLVLFLAGVACALLPRETKGCQIQ